MIKVKHTYAANLCDDVSAMKAASDSIGAQILAATGRRSYRVGGWVRALVMPPSANDIPKDADLTTGATPEQVQAAVPDATLVTSIFPRFVAVRNGHEIEIASFRGYRPGAAKVFPPPLLSDLPEDVAISIDACRRDLTINSLYEAVDTGEIVDPQGGLADIKNRVIRANGVPKERVVEIKQRMLRAIRFACQYDFKLDSKLYRAISAKSPELFCAHCVDTNYCGCSEHEGLTSAQLQFEQKDLVGELLIRIIGGRDPVRGMKLLRKTGILKRVLPEVDCVFSKQRAGAALLSELNRHKGQGGAEMMAIVLRHGVNDDAAAVTKICHRLGMPSLKAA
jgi:tRNA nucleotidyltransferase (CCA-adding enzyme)